MKKIIISGGGTGGHIFPALSIANAIKKDAPDVEILFVGAEGKMEMDVVPKNGYSIVGLPIKGFNRRSIVANFQVIKCLLQSLVKARKIIKDFQPDAVVGVGGYASGPICFQAAMNNTPVFLQEQNSFAGVTNRILGRFARKIFVAYDHMEKFFASNRIEKTGNPVRNNLLDPIDINKAKEFYRIGTAQKVVLITGGSLGAATLNSSMYRVLEKLNQFPNVVFLWQCGKYYYEKISEDIGTKYENIRLMPFIEKMDYAYAIADVVVSRAGASTISELSVLGKPAILIPSPNVSEDHQTHNAMALVEKNAALFVPDKDAPDLIVERIKELIDDPRKCEVLSHNIKEMGCFGADHKIAQFILASIDNNETK